MSYTFPIVSAVAFTTPPVTITVPDASNHRRAKRAALFIARKQMGIVQPVVFDREVVEAARRAEHAAAVAFREKVLAEHHQSMPPLNGTSRPWWQQASRAPLYDDR